MIIHLVSDLHLEFGYQELPGGDVLILAGDICEYRTLKNDFHKTKLLDRVPGAFKSYDFFYSECAKYKQVFMVMGNHEHYHHRFDKTYNLLKSVLPKNVSLLENEVEEYRGVLFLGATLWTDLNKGDPVTRYTIKGVMNDYRVIRNSDHGFRRLTPEDTALRHRTSMAYIQHMIEGQLDQKFVVVGHHSPSKLSTKPQYEGDVIVNGAYSSDLSELMLDHPQICMWTHGHTHEMFDYMIGSTRVVCNPRGYVGHEQQASDWRLMTVEV